MRSFWFFNTWAGRLLLGFVLFGVMVGVRGVFGSRDGESCNDPFLCSAIPARCVITPAGGFCSRPCMDDKGCPSGWKCADVPRGTRIEQACLKPDAAGPFSIGKRRL